ncbi:MAG TPA: pentapeptide repeat-containing protein, partial [Cyanophyceae cyanobacterium]
IHLGQITLGDTLEQTLENAIPVGRFTDTDGWLAPYSPPCVLIFDGLDELRGSSYRSRHLWTFVDQVIRFHAQDMGLSGRPRHKIVLTSRSHSLDCLIRKYRQSSTLPLPTQLRRIVIQPMGQDEFRQWFLHWAHVQSKSIAQTYFTFLKQGGVFHQRPAVQEIAALLSRPLMLFLMGLLHRDGWMDESIFQLDAQQVKFEIYDRITRWLLGEPAAGNGPIPELIREGLAHATRSLEAIANLLQGRHPQQLRQQMQLAALTIVKTGLYQAPQVTIDQQLNSDTTSRKKCQLLPPLFFRSESTKLAFAHPSLGEYLAAEEVAAQLIALTRTVSNRYGEVIFAIREPVHVAEHVYALLGYGLLSPEMEELAIARLRQEEKRNRDVFSFSVLFKRLYSFYRVYCWGRWFDEGIAHQAHSQLQRLDNPLGVLQVDAAVGVNVFLLLCAAAKEAKIPFFPCGQPDISQEFDADRLLSFIGRTVALSPTVFWQRVRHRLSKIELPEACLNRAMLAEANLFQANLSSAELVGINLTAANLQEANLLRANLMGANLVNANLAGAQLEGANLTGANLTGANLTSANLANACLFHAQLDEQSRNFAIRSGAIFSLEEFQVYNQSLVPTLIAGQYENDDLEDEPTIFIESAEGEPILPDAVSRVDENCYDGETAQIEEVDKSDSIFD